MTDFCEGNVLFKVFSILAFQVPTVPDMILGTDTYNF